MVASLASPLSHYVSGTESGLSCLRLPASVQLNSNMSESLRHLCVPPCVHCVPCLPLYIHCTKTDSVLTQPTQGKKRTVGARLYIVSSAYKLQFLTCIGKSFMNRRNRIGPNIDP